MRPKWILPERVAEDKVFKLSQEMEILPLIARLLVTKGIESPEEAKKFLSPSLHNLHNPWLMNDMESAVIRIVQALKDRERVMLYGDYDVDGITGTALLYSVLRNLGGDVSYYLPNRLKEGYGISMVGINEAKRRGATLIISIDCGISANSEVNWGNELGIDFIITDHHEPKQSLPKAKAILNPKRSDSTYPYLELAGVGITYKLAQALLQYLKKDEAEIEEHLDLVALGSLADVVPLTGENRIFAKFGLAQLKETQKIGLKSLLELSGLKDTKELTNAHVGFVLAPRINAVGRLSDATWGIELLLNEDEKKALQIARILDSENRERKEIDERILSQAISMVEDTVDLSEEKVIVLASPEWHQGVIGIVASRLVEQYFRPTVMIALDGPRGKGSARSIPGFHLYESLKKCEEYLLNFGGHKYAAGFVLETERVESLRKKLNEVAKETLSLEDLIPKLRIDGIANLKEIDFPLFHYLKAFSPFGPENPQPTFLSQNVEVVGCPRVVGENHLKFKVRQGEKVMDSIGFGLGEHLKNLPIGKPNLNLVFTLEEDSYWGKQKLLLRVKDMVLA